MMISLDTRHWEDAADSLARLDSLCTRAPAAFGTAVRLNAIADLEDDASKGMRSLAILYSSPVTDGLAPDLARWLSFIDDEERRARGGAQLTFKRLRDSGALAAAQAEHVDAALRTGAILSGADRPSALHRALDLAAAIGDRSLGEAAAALILCTEGRTDRVRILPFGRVRGDIRDDATNRWRDGERHAWARLALHALVDEARGRRLAIERAIASIATEDASIAELGRAAITARQVIALLREEFVASVPTLSETLRLSRPAAGDAIERLETLGLVTELTGRKRDRVFAYRAALAALG